MATRSFELWRQDDNGNRFLVGSYAERADAERRLAELTRLLHKQTYWITEKEVTALAREEGS
ncbi:hypothetical protein [Geobacter argillaceus]|uniref:SPOR domain-containing protein n=1 Tax=Geobacter argillaceus TaxID=345631 RepID=A0A562VGN7_9BACT|nr:hypothetical protein [Geobacter argillaceus]TWJ17069.1 hypothetical protein JN12_03181 [Geobacter argillaceus]